MATVSITITGKQSSRVKIQHHAPGDVDNGTGNIRSTSTTTNWGKHDWEAMLTDDKAAGYVVATLGVSFDDLRAGIRSMQEVAKYHGPAVYRAACGHELYDRTDGTVKRRKLEVLRGHKGDERHMNPERRQDKPVPEMCANCPKLRAEVFNYLARDDYEGLGKDVGLFPQTLFVCRTFAMVPGAVPPPGEQGKGEQRGEV